MQKFTKITSQVIPIPRKDIDTDIIIPAQYLTAINKEGFGKNLFKRFRRHPDFKFLKKFPKAKFLITRENFGCGSSREHAVWALKDYGFRAILAPSFANIFQNNALKNGLLLITLPPKIINEIIDSAQSQKTYKITIDLEKQKVTLPTKKEHEFEIDRYRQKCILSGMNDLDYLLSQRRIIKEFDKKRAQKLFFDHSLVP